MPEYDVSLGPGGHGDMSKPLAHTPDCPFVRAQADQGEPVITMFGCTSPLPADIDRHNCLEETNA